ncbi:MAG: hypothetical protein R2698_05110 [Microthrixaceae bacterium]
MDPVWSAKGGVGCSTVAVAMAAARSRRSASTILVDLAGDLAILGDVGHPPGHGVTDWLQSDAPTACLDELIRPLAPGVDLVPTGSGTRWSEERLLSLLEWCSSTDRPVVLDVGVVPVRAVTALGATRRHLARRADSLLVTTACYLALRRLEELSVRPGRGAVLLREPGRRLGRVEVAELVGAPVVAQLDRDPLIARSVDSGRILGRAPRSMTRALGRIR